MQQFFLMLRGPFHCEPQCPMGDISLQYHERVDPDRYTVFAIPCMEMGRIMVIVKHRNYDTVESTNLWHLRIYFTPH